MAEQLRTALAILRRKQVERETGLSRSHLYQRIKDGTFPAPIKLGPKAVGWRAGDIDRFLVDPANYRTEA
ncbi:AlpA family transcriptional regulator [Burkholderia ubonensis]|uniref:helix-turn-helix transcriptional regulator n=1 Tax=Burkholderia ubonensis TaxID=101571 RepID=UPI0007571329|nr:AlpA family phage regulatory protein [Burkholderia ubonensis]KVD85366.1 AlpA family transcriptional regulator [Burkholderia ubonensis]